MQWMEVYGYEILVKGYPDLKQKTEEMDVTDLIRAVICPDIRVGEKVPRNTSAVFFHPATVTEANAFSAEINSDREEPALIACSVLGAPSWALISARRNGPVARNMMKGWMRFRIPAVFVAWQSVCFEDVYLASTDTVINTYGYTKYTPSAVAEMICGRSWGIPRRLNIGLRKI